MGIQFFEEPIITGGDTLFAKEYLEEHPKEDGKQYRVTEVLLVRSQKGYLLKTDRFAGFIWKRSSTAKLLVQALEIYVRDLYGYSVVAVLDVKSKDGFRLGIDPELPCMWYGTGKKFTTTLDIPSFDVDTVNPFLIPPAPSTPTMEQQTENGSKQGQSQRRSGKAT